MAFSFFPTEHSRQEASLSTRWEVRSPFRSCTVCRGIVSVLHERLLFVMFPAPPLYFRDRRPTQHRCGTICPCNHCFILAFLARHLKTSFAQPSGIGKLVGSPWPPTAVFCGVKRRKDLKRYSIKYKIVKKINAG